MRFGLVVSVLLLTLVATGCASSQTALSEQTAALRPMLAERLSLNPSPSGEGGPGEKRAGEGLKPVGASPADLAAERTMLAALQSANAGRPTILDAPAAAPPADAAPVVAGDVKSGAAAPAHVRWWQQPPEPGYWQPPIGDRSFFEVVKDDGLNFPREFFKSAGDCVNVPAGLVLTGAAILAGVSRVNWDHHVDKSMLYDYSPKSNFFSKSDHWGDDLGNPVTGWGIAMLCYGWSVETKNDEFYGFSKSLMQALIIDDAVTPALKFAAHTHSPNGDDHYAWPSGHTSSTATMAAVAWDYYGPAAGVPLYLFSGFVAVSMMHERQHWLSDVIFGEVLGTVIGHSVAGNRLLHVGGFTVLPYARSDGGGVLLVKEF